MLVKIYTSESPLPHPRLTYSKGQLLTPLKAEGLLTYQQSIAGIRKPTSASAGVPVRDSGRSGSAASALGALLLRLHLG